MVIVKFKNALFYNSCNLVLNKYKVLLGIKFQFNGKALCILHTIILKEVYDAFITVILHLVTIKRLFNGMFSKLFYFDQSTSNDIEANVNPAYIIKLYELTLGHTN